MRKRQYLVDTAFRLFYEHGIHAVGINQVLQEAGVAKQTLYNHFECKDNLVVAVVERRDQVFFQWLENRLQQVPTGRDALLEIFSAIDDWINDRVEGLHRFHGCFFINTCGEYGDTSHPIHKQCAAHKLRVETLIHQHVQALGTGETESDRLTHGLFMLKEGAIIKAHVKGDRSAALQARQVADSWLPQSESA